MIKSKVEKALSTKFPKINPNLEEIEEEMEQSVESSPIHSSHKDIFVKKEKIETHANEKIDKNEKITLDVKPAKPKKSKKYEHLQKARLKGLEVRREKARIKREHKQAEKEEKAKIKAERKLERQEKNRKASRERYWKKKEVDSKNIEKTGFNSKGIFQKKMDYDTFTQYMDKYNTRSNSTNPVKIPVKKNISFSQIIDKEEFIRKQNIKIKKEEEDKKINSYQHPNYPLRHLTNKYQRKKRVWEWN
tara:strand:+ start:196 stop:936 length:741 start_codon:yes stop_codon:yes gene_type:complete